MSGAAPDTPPSRGWWGALRTYLGWQFGRNIWGLNKEEGNDRNYYLLSDGGHSENLAAFSLIRRHCKDVTIVDAEEDQDYTFEGYRILKDMVLKHLRGELVIDEIDDRLKSLKRPCISDNKCHISPSERVPWKNPVMKGVVSLPSPITNSNAQREQVCLHVTYIKLSYFNGPQALHSVPSAKASGSAFADCVPSVGNVKQVQISYSELTTSTGEKDSNVFPQYSTYNQFLNTLSAVPCEALLDLGFSHATAAIQLE